MKVRFFLSIKGKGIKLTHGAKALAKHHHRSSSKYWGTFHGNGEQFLSSIYEREKIESWFDVKFFWQCTWLIILCKTLSPDSDKNRLAMNTIVHLIAHSCWLNIHMVAPHGIVFEIRIAEGYGARWSNDGNKVSLLYEAPFSYL